MEKTFNESYVNTLYINVLGRDYDQTGYDYWLSNFNNGVETKYELLLGFSEYENGMTILNDWILLIYGLLNLSCICLELQISSHSLLNTQKIAKR